MHIYLFYRSIVFEVANTFNNSFDETPVFVRMSL